MGTGLLREECVRLDLLRESIKSSSQDPKCERGKLFRKRWFLCTSQEVGRMQRLLIVCEEWGRSRKLRGRIIQILECHVKTNKVLNGFKCK